MNLSRIILSFCVVLSVAGCHFKKYRLLKALNGRVQVLDTIFEAGPSLVQASYRSGEGASFVPYRLDVDPDTKHLRPPQISSKAAIDLSVSPGVNHKALQLRIFLKKDPQFDGDLVEVKTIIGEIPGSLPNAITFVEDLFPKRHQRLLLYPDDLIGPYQGIRLQARDWLVLYIEDQSTYEVQKLVFEYVPMGYRVSTGAHLLFSTGVNLLDIGVAQITSTQAAQARAPRRRSELADASGQIDPGGLDLALTFTASVGYRGEARNGPRRWFADNFTLVFDVGVGNVGEVEKILQEGTEFEERVAVLQNQLLLGVGVQVFDFVSLHLLNNVVANFPTRDGVDVEAVLIPELGFDVVTAARFSRRLYERLFKPTIRRTLPLPASAPLAPTRLIVKSCQRETTHPCPEEGAQLDESYRTPVN